MKKIISLLLTLFLALNISNTVFADENDGETISLSSFIDIISEMQNYSYILPMEYVRIERLDNCYIVYDKQEKCAIYSLDGEKLSDDYDYIGAFYNEQVTLAKKDNADYIINAYGTVIGKFDKKVINVADYVLVNLTDSNNDGRPTSYYEGEFGVYTYSGELVKVLPYESFKPYRNEGIWMTFMGGRLLFRENEKWGAVDSDFNTVIEPVYDKIYPFSDPESGITIAIMNDKYGLIDRDGNIVADFVYDIIDPLYFDGDVNAYRVMQGGTYMAMQGEKYGLLDKNGKMIKQPDEYVPKVLYEDYNLIEIFKKNTRADSDEYGELCGLIDYDGNIVIPVVHTNIWNISEGIVCAQKSYDHCGYYDIDGNEITEFKYRMTSPFSDGLAFASSCINNVWTHEVIDKSGEVVFNPDGWANGFYGGIAKVETGKIIDTNGKIVIDNSEWESSSGLDWWSYRDDGKFIVSDGENYGVVKYNGFVSPWAKESVAQAKKIKLINADGSYNYTAFITREGFCELIFNYLENIAHISPESDNDMPFDDTDNAHIGVLNSMGIINGKSAAVFAPNDFLTREEAAAIIFRLINTVYPDWIAPEQYFDFADSAQISGWAMNNIQVICNMGIMKGVEDNKFAPLDNYTTEQAIATLVRVHDKFN